MKKTLTLMLVVMGQLAVAQSATKRDFKKLLKTLPGEYDAPQMHILIAKINVPTLGENVFYTRYFDKIKAKRYRQRLQSWDFKDGTITQRSFSVVPDSLYDNLHQHPENISAVAKNLKPSLECASVWQKTGDHFEGTIRDCPMYSERRKGNILISDKQYLSSKALKTSEWAKDQSGAILFGDANKYALELQKVR